MLKKKIATTLTAVTRLCPKCGKQVKLSPKKATTKCPGCNAIVHEEEELDERKQ